METNGKHVDRESRVFKQLKGRYKHFCPDWDYMAIDENSPEFDACSCGLQPLKSEVDHRMRRTGLLVNGSLIVSGLALCAWIIWELVKLVK